MTASTDNGQRAAMRHELLLRETNHRCSNDLQLVVGLLALQARRATSAEVKGALNDAMERIAVLARNRRAIHDEPQSLGAALQEVCNALHAQAEPRQIVVAFHPLGDLNGLSATSITTLALVVNELATNAIKHAFEEGKAGRIDVTAKSTGRDMVVIVDDDGLPFPKAGSEGKGLGMDLARKLMASIDGLFIPPGPDLKIFELRAPVQ